MSLISKEHIRKALDSLPGWSYDTDSIVKQYEFEDFSEAFGFLSRIALLSEKLNHHAHWSGVYNVVKLELSTHDAGGVTEKDIRFASMAEACV